MSNVLVSSPKQNRQDLWKEAISEASFWTPELLVDSAWLTHGPFAFWLVESARPRVVVELGTHRGFSYAAFCQAVKAAKIGAKCFAVDTWQGDEHAGFYENDVWQSLMAHHEPRYSGFSNLLRMTFDEALPYFDDGSIDLLHIDGRHHYADVRHDFEAWLPKLSDRAIVLFHDTNVRERDFGVFRFWNELSPRYRSFEFLHGHGLGVLAVGNDIPMGVQALFECTAGSDNRIRLQAAYANLGEAVKKEWVASYRTEELQRTIARLEGSIHERDAAIRERDDAILKKDEELRQREAREVSTVKRQESAELVKLRQQLAQEGQRSRELKLHIDSIFASSSWRVTAPFRSTFFQRVYRAYGKIKAGRPLAVDQSTKQDPTSGRRRIVFVSGEAHTPGHFYRIERYAAAAKSAGFDVTSFDIHDLRVSDSLFHDVALLIVWRAEWSESLDRLFASARQRMVKIVFDVDDLMIDPSLARADIIDAISTMNIPEEQVAAMYSRILTTFAQADYGSAPTAFLAQYMRRFQKPAFVMPNGFDDEALELARLSVRRRHLQQPDGTERIGYAGGTRTHRRDFAQAVNAIARVLRERPQAKFVTFVHNGEPILDLSAYEQFNDLYNQIEWRESVPLKDLPQELARFDINLAPLEYLNPFCEAKSELKYFEAALVGVPTIASPTHTFTDAIQHGVTGMLAEDDEAWYRAMTELLDGPEKRAAMGQSAFHDVLWKYGPERRADAIVSLVGQTTGKGSTAARGFWAQAVHPVTAKPSALVIPAHSILFEKDRLETARVTVVIPLYNYANHVLEALNSVKAQTLSTIDLVVIDDCSTDNSCSIAQEWLTVNHSRFNRVQLCRNNQNSGLALTRNTGFFRAETQFVLPLDADNMLTPDCAKRCLEIIAGSNAAFVFPQIQKFGSSTELIGTIPYDPVRLVGGNYIDAMALIRKAAWSEVGGYDHIEFGWEDYDFWCKLVEQGMWGQQIPETLAMYRVHPDSMLATQTDLAGNKTALIQTMERRHPWLKIATE